MREVIAMNRGWQYAARFSEALLAPEYDGETVTVTLPHTTAVTPMHYFDESRYETVCGYRRVLAVPEEWRGKRILLTVEGAAHHTVVYVNGRSATSHACGYTAFTADLSPYLEYGAQNVLVLRVDSRESLNQPPFGHVVDYMTFGGLYREVSLTVTAPEAVDDVFVRTRRLKATDGTQRQGAVYALCPDVTCTAAVGKAPEARLCFVLLDGRKSEVERWEALPGQPKEIVVSGVSEWDTERPALYVLRTQLTVGGVVTDEREDRFGFREARFAADGFYLNGTKTKLRGLNRHQSYPYVGYAMPASMQRFDAKVLKNELGVNAVRTSHYPQSRHFLDCCDELGLLVFTEIPGWQHLGDEAWKEQAVENTRDMVLQNRNHPSVILWGVRINESQDDDELYRRTNETAHALDGTRSTSGVRYLTNSSLLEDVYAFNDFSHEGDNAGCKRRSAVTKESGKAYLISEYNGHMYPTKAFDAEDHRVEHLLRHARVMDAYYGQEDIAGGFGWCMFDYNTHKDFGSGDRVCYHGVCDMFRNPKPAAYVYRSQREEEDVLFISSSMDIGEHPACLRKDVYAVTNADSVRVYMNDEFVREFGKEETPFSHLPHGPILLDDFIGERMERGEGFSHAKSEDVKKILLSACRNGMGHLPLSTLALAAKCVLFRGMRMQDAVDLYSKYVGNWGGASPVYRFEAVLDGKVVKTVEKRPVKQRRLAVQVSEDTLIEADTYDVAAVRIRAVDESGEVLAFANVPLSLSLEGEAELIGPSLIALNGGLGGTYVRSIGTAGKAKLVIRSEDMDPVEVSFVIERRSGSEGGNDGQKQSYFWKSDGETGSSEGGAFQEKVSEKVRG